jgi:hypothetical protein
MRKILAGLAALLIGFTIACGASGSDEPAPGNEQKPVSAATTAEQPTPEPTIAPLPADFTLKVVTLSKQCFGSAGCNVTYRIEVAYGGLPMPEDKEYTVTYAVSGVEGGPQVNNFKLRGDQVEYPSEEYASTPSSRTVLTAKVTQVLS